MHEEAFTSQWLGWSGHVRLGSGGPSLRKPKQILGTFALRWNCSFPLVFRVLDVCRDAPIVQLMICTNSKLISIYPMGLQELRWEKYYNLCSGQIQLIWIVSNQHLLYQFPSKFEAISLWVKDWSVNNGRWFARLT